MTTELQTQVLTNEDFTALLREKGFLEKNESSGYNKIKVDGLTFNVGDEMYVSNPKTGTPAFLARIIDVPAEYQGVWITQDHADGIGRPELGDSYCKSRFGVDGEDRKFSNQGASCSGCPIGPFVKKDDLLAGPWQKDTKCKWRGELPIQILNADGKIADETVWTLDLPTTGMIEFKGVSREPQKGHIGELNFTQLLARLGADGDKENPTRGFMRALSSLRLGGVVAEVRSVPAQSSNGAIRYSVIQLRPVQILDVDVPTTDQTALPAGASSADLDDDLPF